MPRATASAPDADAALSEPPRTGELRVGILGPLEVRVGGRLVALSPQQRAVLAVLVLDANRVVAAERLIDQVWNGRPPPTAPDLLHGLVARLRRALRTGEEGRVRQPLLTRPPGYLFQVRAGELDVDRFAALERAARRSLRSGGRAALVTAAGLLAEALRLWRGPILAGLSVDACAPAAAGLEERCWAVLERRIDLDLRLGRFGELCAELPGHVHAQPLRERLWAQLLVALQAADRQADALRAYQQLREILVEQLGVEPGGLVRQVHRAILTGDDALLRYRRQVEDPPEVRAGAEPGGGADAGRTGTDEPPGPDADPGGPGSDGGASAPAGRVTPAQLPVPTASFVGRDHYLDQLDAWLEAAGDGGSAHAVICVLTGMAGVGKTALAIHWAERVRDRFPDGQLYVDLRGYAPAPPYRPIKALAGFLHALGIPPGRVPVDVEEAAGLYRSLLAGRRVLVVLDNARDPAQVRPLLPGGRGSLALVTSRDRLGGLVAREGAHRLNLAELTAGEARILLTRLLGAARVAAEPSATEELARRCAYLPLALRIAAANLTDGPGHRIAGHVATLSDRNRLAALRVDGDEQTAIRAAFDLSYATLSPLAKRLFRRLGPAPGADVGVAAAAVLAGVTAGEAEQTLGQLSRAHLLDQRLPGRYSLHDLLRLYATERAARDDRPGELAAAIGRLLDRYLRNADAAARLLYPEMLRLPMPAIDPEPEPEPGPVAGFDDHRQALAWLEAERGNLVAAVQHAASNGPRPAAWQLADALRGYLWLTLRTVDWLVVTRSALAAAEAAGDRPGQAATHLSLANLHDRRGRFQPAIEHYTRALAISRRIGWREGESAALNNIANVEQQVGRLDAAATHYTQAMELDRQTSPQRRAITLGNLGLVLHDLGRLEPALAHYAESLLLYRAVGSRLGEAIAHLNLGETCHALGRWEEARGHLNQALDLFREVGDRSNQAEVGRVLAGLDCDAGRYRQALEVGRHALAGAQAAGERRVEAGVRSTLGCVHHRAGRPATALAEYQRALRLARELTVPLYQVTALAGLASVRDELGHADEALDCARAALTGARQAGFAVQEGQSLTVLAAVELRADRLDPAAEYADQALVVQRATGHRLGQARTLLLRGRIRHRGGEGAAARRDWRLALRLFTDLAAPEAELTSRLLNGGGPTG